MEQDKQDVKKENCGIDEKVSRNFGPVSRYSFDLINLIGFPKSEQDINNLRERYGIDYAEFLEPKKETLEKVRNYIRNNKINKRF